MPNQDVRVASASEGRLCEAGTVPEYACPNCGEEFDSVWHVTVGDAGDYKPVFGGPVELGIGRCNTCNMSFERRNDGQWSRQRSTSA